MSDDRGDDRGAALMRDWVAIWESECAARMADRETRELAAGLVARWAEAAGAMLAQTAGWADGGGCAARPDAAAGAAPAMAASGPGDAALVELERRVSRLERRDAAAPEPGG